jgi:phosphatidylserine/phosphatidylglycerophosphate/cardiolipin synthase-like enzyme
MYGFYQALCIYNLPPFRRFSIQICFISFTILNDSELYLLLQTADYKPFAKTLQPPNTVAFVELWSPVDDIRGALLKTITSATNSIVIAMFGFDDDELADAIKAKLADPNVFVQLSLDASQAGGVHEREILAREDYPASNIAVGHSEKGAIMHLKLLVVDGWATVTGSTNWDTSAETLQDNHLVIVLDYLVAYGARQRCDIIHSEMLSKGPK